MSLIPTIGLLSHRTEKGSDGLRHYKTVEHYINALSPHTTLPIIVPTGHVGESRQQLIRLLDGLIVVGGRNVAPHLYLEDQEHEPSQFVQDDLAEANILRMAIANNVPTLGICRGMQLLNVALGGTLHTDIFEQGISQFNHAFDWRNSPEKRHQISIVDNDMICERLPSLGVCSKYLVNSSHTQSIRDLGHDLEIWAYSEDRVVEAVFVPNKPFVVGVQWHPECLSFDSAVGGKIIKDFVFHAKHRSWSRQHG